MSDLPPALTPPDCDLRGMPFMPVDLVRLMDSDLYALSSGDEFKAAFTLWGKSWLQVPAASLPDDDRILAHLSGAGARWAKVKAMALRGWVKCADGRLYHPVVAEKAREAWAYRVRQRERSAKANAARWGGGKDDPDASPQASPRGSPRASPEVSRNDPKGQGQLRERRATPYAAASPREPAEPSDARTELWGEGLRRLRRITGKPDGAARALLGRFCREARDDCALLAGILHQAEADRPGDPVAWISATIQNRTGRRPGEAARPSKLAWMDQLSSPRRSAFCDGSAEEIQQ